MGGIKNMIDNMNAEGARAGLSQGAPISGSTPDAPALIKALERAAETFSDFERVCLLLNHKALALAAGIAARDAREVVARSNQHDAATNGEKK